MSGFIAFQSRELAIRTQSRMDRADGCSGRGGSADRRALRNLGEELVVGLECLESVDQQLEGRRAATVTVLMQAGENAAQLEYLLHLAAVEEQLFVTGRRCRYVDRRID